MMQKTAVQPAAPATPAAPGTEIVTTRAVNASAVSLQDVAALKARRAALSEQLSSASGRRHDIARELRSATGADRAGLEQRLAQLDARIARLESDIDENSKALASPEVARLSSRAGSTSNGPSFVIGPQAQQKIADNVIPLFGMFSVFVLFPMAMSLSRMFWRRGSLPATSAAGFDRESAKRLERMEQAMDAIAIEVERVSEGQRFVTRLLSERPTPLGAGERPMEELRSPVEERVRR